MGQIGIIGETKVRRVNEKKIVALDGKMADVSNTWFTSNVIKYIEYDLSNPKVFRI